MGIKNTIINTILYLIPNFIKRRIITYSDQSGTQIYSQEGEDKLLERFIGKKNYGIYVDIGAHHPSIISNTYFFYKKGWRGINIDAMPQSMDLFKKLRPYDINLEVPISDNEEELLFYIFNTPELNTFDEKKIDHFLEYPNVELVNKIKLKTTTLADVLDLHLSKFGTTQIDFFSIDVEGWDLKVLKSNNWNKYRPDFILVEDLFATILESYNSELNAYMKSLNYTIKAKTYNTIVFQKND